MKALFVAALMVPAPGALAQSAATASPTPPKAAPGRPAAPAARPKVVEGVTVNGAPPAYRSAIDRRSYSVANDLQATSGSLADALRNVPSVEVDVQGGVSLRGDSNVTILIDGKPSGMFQGQNRADALQQLPANTIDRVEVLTNPSAAFKPDGAAGVINLITKKGRGAGRTGSVRANLGTGDRYNASLSASYNADKLSLSGSAGVRLDVFRIDNATTRNVIDPLTGALSPSRSDGRGTSGNTSQNVRGSLDYDVDAKTRISAEIGRFGVDFASQTSSAYRSAAATGPLAEDYDLNSRGDGGFTNTAGAVSLLRKFSGDEHELSLRLSHDQNVNGFESRQTFAYRRPARPDLYQDVASTSDQGETEFKAEYKRPLGPTAKMVVGYELELSDDRFDNRSSLGTSPADAAPSAVLSNLFKVDQTVHALYATYQRTFGKLTVLPGLRLEAVDIDADQVTSRLRGGQDYDSAYPTLHLAYKLSDAQQVTASYSRRVQRPDLQSLNPFRVYNSPLSYSQGNPQLRPQITQSFEGGYEFRRSGTYYQATLYYRENTRGFTDVVQDLGGGVLLTTKANLGRSRSGGLELVANGRLSKTVTYNLSGNLFWNEIDASNIGVATRRSAVTVSGRASLNWEPTTKDVFQLSGSARGEQLTAQGYRAASLALNLGYRHKFNDKLSGVITIQDPLDASGSTLVIDTPGLQQRIETDFHVRALYVGLTYAFGASNKRRPESFDFGGGGGAGPQ